ncbi:recombinase family protein [Pseudonocardia sp. ICBG601]|uniref:recombinase family protein n=1 Tax=Pseudonocardia sp. ICBG601 TaxID=2846759 RepID=UPI001CF61391|nr:recombinase family protein [Pseudonocardia sp. ICBG601]
MPKVANAASAPAVGLSLGKNSGPKTRVIAGYDGSMVTAIYCRASSAKQQVREDGVKGSIDQQLALCFERAEALGISDEVLVLAEVKSATKKDKKTGRVHRAKFDELCAGITSGAITHVIAYDSDRIMRDPHDGETFIDACDGRNVHIDTLQSGKYKIATPDDRLMTRMVVAMNAREIEKLRERTKRGLAARADAGLPHGGPRSFGFQAGNIHHDAVEADAIRSATRQVLAGSSLRSITIEWNKAGLRTAGAAPGSWTPGTLRGMLLNPRNAGLMTRDGSISAVKPQWEPIITYEDWSSMHAILNEPSRRTNVGAPPRWLLSNIAHCACGGRLRVKGSGCNRSKTTCPRYECRRYTHEYPADGHRAPGPHSSTRAEALDEFVSDKLVRAYHEAGVGFPQPRAVFNAESLTERRAEIQNKREELKSLWRTSVITADELTVELAMLDRRLEQEPATMIQETPERNATLDELFTEWSELPLDQRRQIVKDSASVKVLATGRGRRVALEDRVILEIQIPQ